MLIPVIVYIIFLVIFAVFAAFAVYHALRFGFVGDATKYVTTGFVVFSLVIIILTLIYILGIDLNQSFDFSIFGL